MAQPDYPTLEIGRQAPDFVLPGIDGKNYSLEDFKDSEFLVIIFTCNHCPTAQSYEERIIRLVDDYSVRGVGFLAVSPNGPLAIRLDELGYTDLGDDPEDMKIRAEYRNFNFPYVYDGETQEMSKKYGPVATPHLNELRQGLGKLDYTVFLVELSKLKDVPLMMEHPDSAEACSLAAEYIRTVAASRETAPFRKISGDGNQFDYRKSFGIRSTTRQE